MTTTRDRRRPFGERGMLLLNYINDMKQVVSETPREEFMAKRTPVLAAAKLVELAGELLHPDMGHASPELSREFHAARNAIVHEYASYPWIRFGSCCVKPTVWKPKCWSALNPAAKSRRHHPAGDSPASHVEHAGRQGRQLVDWPGVRVPCVIVDFPCGDVPYSSLMTCAGARFAGLPVEYNSPNRPRG